MKSIVAVCQAVGLIMSVTDGAQVPMPASDVQEKI